MLKLANAILAAMIRDAQIYQSGFSTREELQEVVLSSGKGWANKAICHLLHSGLIAQSGDFFVVTRKGAEQA